MFVVTRHMYSKGKKLVKYAFQSKENYVKSEQILTVNFFAGFPILKLNFTKFPRYCPVGRNHASIDWVWETS